MPIAKKIARPKKQSNAASKQTSATRAIAPSKGYNPIEPKRVSEILARLEKTYGGAKCALHHRNAWELLVATILSAQCTDVRVNMVTPELFAMYPTPESLAKKKPEDIEPLIKSTGFFRNKAKSIIGAAKAVTEQFGGKV